jgi:hypothetical protein
MPRGDVNKMLPAYEAYTRALQGAGVLVAGSRLQTTDSASTIRVRDGKSQVLDGPYAETKEQLGGYYLIEAETLDAAIEVRPLWQMTA